MATPNRATGLDFLQPPTGGGRFLQGSGVYLGDRLSAPADAVPIAVGVRSDAARGFSLLRLSAARVPLRDLINYFINSPTAEMLGGEARNVDLRLYALDLNAPHPQGFHVTGGVTLDGAGLVIPGLRVPLRNLAGRLDVFDGGLAAPDAQGSLGGLTVRLAGGLYDWNAPELRLGLRAAGGLEQVRLLFAFSRRLPLRGGLSLRGLVEGPVGQPLVATRFIAPAIGYDRIPLHDVAGDAVYYDSSVVLAPVTAGYGPLSAGGTPR